MHDKNLLKAVSENGLSFLSRLKQNKEYDFDMIKISRKKLLRRVEQLCLFFKNLLPKYKKLFETTEKKSRAGDTSTG